MTLCATINLFDFKFTESGDRASAVLSVAVATVTYLTPFAILLFIWRMRAQLEHKEVLARYGSLYEGLRVKRVSQLLCSFLFVTRRLVLVMVAIFLWEHPSFQVMIYVLTSQLSLMYIILVRPYDSRATNYNEMFNEACVILSSY